MCDFYPKGFTDDVLAVFVSFFAPFPLCVPRASSKKRINVALIIIIFIFFFSSVPVTFSYKNWRLKPLVRCHGFMRNNITSVYNNVYKTFFFFFLLNGKLTTLVIRVFTIIYSAHISFVLRGDRIRDCFVAKYKFNAIVVQIIDNI